MSVPTQITIRPDRDLNVAAFPNSAKRLAGERASFGVPAAQADARFFGEDGPGISDIVDAINPLRHIPFISTLYDEATGTTASAVSKLVGGTLLGGPIGFIAALGTVIFEQSTGHSPVGAVVAALRGEENPNTQLAAAAPETSDVTQQVAASLIPVETQSIDVQQAPPKPDEVARLVQDTQMQMASAIDAVGASDATADADMLALFGQQNASAHASYRKAQFAPYLKDVTTSMVM